MITKQIKTFLQNNDICYVIKGNYNHELSNAVFSTMQKTISKKLAKIGVDYIKCGINLTNLFIHGKGKTLIITSELLSILLSKINCTVNQLLDANIIVEYNYSIHETFLRKRQERLKNKREKLKKERTEVELLTNMHNIGVPLNKNQWIKVNKQILEIHKPKFETALVNKLKKSVKWRILTQEPFIINDKTFFADIYIPCKKTVIEIDGGYHTTAEQILKDAQRDDYFRSIGIVTLRIENEDVSKINIKQLVKQITENRKASLRNSK